MLSFFFIRNYRFLYALQLGSRIPQSKRVYIIQITSSYKPLRIAQLDAYYAAYLTTRSWTKGCISSIYLPTSKKSYIIASYLINSIILSMLYSSSESSILMRISLSLAAIRQYLTSSLIYYSLNRQLCGPRTYSILPQRCLS